jgi:uncharacterized protein YbgA (DUF1722 family)/uncharacterized protein YbbK (DUF523 family)
MKSSGAAAASGLELSGMSRSAYHGVRAPATGAPAPRTTNRVQSIGGLVTRHPALDRIRVGISACLLGEPVRFDGGHKRDPLLTESFGRFFEWVPVCPEVEIGLGTPRPALRLVASPEGPRLRLQKDGDDLTGAMRHYARQRLGELEEADLSGFILKKDSPSCGLERVRVYPAAGPAARTGRGVFAQALVARFPDLPVEEEGRLQDHRLRENFVERVFAYRRLQALFAARWRAADVIRFHSRHKFAVMAHSPAAYQELGRLVAAVASRPRDEFRRSYSVGFMAALRVLATPSRHANVMLHMVGFLKTRLDAASRAELLEAIRDYQSGLTPLVVPLTLLGHHLRRHEVAYLLDQTYLDPHPKELMLRNHV